MKLLKKKWLERKKKSKPNTNNIYLQETFENKTQFTFQYFQQSASDILVSTALWLVSKRKLAENYIAVYAITVRLLKIGGQKFSKSLKDIVT